MVLNCGAVPSIIQLLLWQFGQTTGPESFVAPLQHQEVITVLLEHVNAPIHVKLIPIEKRDLAQQQRGGYNL